MQEVCWIHTYLAYIRARFSICIGILFVLSVGIHIMTFSTYLACTTKPLRVTDGIQ
jgi:hypothetical protein